jgi:hypothetical protein
MAGNDFFMEFLFYFVWLTLEAPRNARMLAQQPSWNLESPEYGFSIRM